jgi:hypothetical protein
MAGKRSIEKGKRGEREVLKLLSDELGIILTRNLEQTRNGGADCVLLKGFALEVKYCKKLSRPTWWRQACKQAEALGVQPILAYRRNREPWSFWVCWPGPSIQETDLQGICKVIREKWLRWP